MDFVQRPLSFFFFFSGGTAKKTVIRGKTIEKCSKEGTNANMVILHVIEKRERKEVKKKCKISNRNTNSKDPL